MYHQYKITKGLTIAIERFNPKAKAISPVYKTGVRFFQTDHFKAYSIVVGRYRLILTKDKPQLNCAN